MSKQFLAVVAGIIIVFVGIVALSSHKSGSSTTSSGTLTNHVMGLNKDNVKLVEYGDYQCPYCGAFYPVLKQLVAQYNNQISFQFTNFPLTSIHPNAFAGARAAEAAGMQNKYWEMHDLLYSQNQAYYNSNQTVSTWINASDPTSYFNQYAQQLGLDLTKFKQDYASSTVNNLINADLNQGTKLGVTGTPAFYLNGKQIQIKSYSVSAFQPFIDAAIAKSAPASTTH